MVCPTYRIQKYNDDSVITIIFCVDYYLLLKKISKKLENKENHAVSNTQEKLVTEGYGYKEMFAFTKIAKIRRPFVYFLVFGILIVITYFSIYDSYFT